jgi:hypothetical protein
MEHWCHADVDVGRDADSVNTDVDTAAEDELVLADKAADKAGGSDDSAAIGTCTGRLRVGTVVLCRAQYFYMTKCAK